MRVAVKSVPRLLRKAAIVPDTDGTREKGVEMDIHCRPWNSISHLLTLDALFGIRNGVAGVETSW